MSILAFSRLLPAVNYQALNFLNNYIKSLLIKKAYTEIFLVPYTGRVPFQKSVDAMYRKILGEMGVPFVEVSCIEDIESQLEKNFDAVPAKEKAEEPKQEEFNKITSEEVKPGVSGLIFS
jgi:hypothetical protein